jgi:hypothetical protein
VNDGPEAIGPVMADAGEAAACARTATTDRPARKRHGEHEAPIALREWLISFHLCEGAPHDNTVQMDEEARGLRLNLGKGSASVRVGPKGAGMTFGSSGTTASAGIPGTGLHYTRKLSKGQRPDEPPKKRGLIRTLVRVIVYFVVASFLLTAAAMVAMALLR